MLLSFLGKLNKIADDNFRQLFVENCPQDHSQLFYEFHRKHFTFRLVYRIMD